MNEAVLHYLKQFNIDLKAVGELVGEGTQHRIFRYQKDKVIKIPKSSPSVQAGKKQSTDIVKRDLEILRLYLREYLINTDVLVCANGAYIIIQTVLPKLVPFAYSHFLLVWDDLNQIVAANRKMAEDKGLSLDLLGNSGYWGCVRATLTRQKRFAFSNNLFVLPRDAEQFTLKIVDINLIPTHIKSTRNFMNPRLVMNAAYYQVQRILLNRIFNVSA